MVIPSNRWPAPTADPADATREWDACASLLEEDANTLPDLDSRFVTAVLVPLDGYRLGRRLGSGAGTEVFEATDRSGAAWAAKLLPADARPRLRASLAREGEVLRALRHDAVPRFGAIGLIGERPALVRGLRAGRDFERVMRLVEPLRDSRDTDPARRRLLAALADACDGVQHAHERGLLHRDLKPANLLAVEGGGGFVLDWGLALRLDERRPDTRVTAGTPGWMAPEQARGARDIGPAADVFSLAAVAFRILTGAGPIVAGTPFQRLESTAAGRVLTLREVDPQGRWAGPWRALLDRALHPRAERRVPSAAALAAGLRALASTLPT